MGRRNTLYKSYHGYVYPMVLCVWAFCFFSMETKGVLGTWNSEAQQALNATRLRESCLVVSSSVEQVCMYLRIFSPLLITDRMDCCLLFMPLMKWDHIYVYIYYLSDCPSCFQLSSHHSVGRCDPIQVNWTVYTKQEVAYDDANASLAKRAVSQVNSLVKRVISQVTN